MAKLTIVEGPDLGTEYELDPFQPNGNSGGFIIGREPSVGASLNDSAISREHCRIEPTRRGFRVIDIGSRNRTFVNGDPVDNSLLRDGDVIRIGDTELRFGGDASDVEVAGVASTIIKELAADDPDRQPLFERVRSVAGVSTGSEAFRQIFSAVQRILDLSGHVSEISSPSMLFEKFLAEIVPTLEAQHGTFLGRENGQWVARASFGETGGSERPLRASLSIVEKAASDKKAILSENTYKDERFQSNESVIHENIRSAIAVPVLRRKRVAGVIYIDRRKIDAPFSELELALLQSATEHLGGLLSKVEDQGRLVDENRNLLRSLTEDRRIMGASQPVKNVLEFIQRAAPTHMTVLIQGETGTGKELAASAIHYNSPRRGRPFVALNCAALPDNLVESELFGHERGAFTGAVARKKGRFELADTGTVFLDEVGELKLPCQAKLLRLLEERCFERVGGTKSISVDIRILAAANKDLLEAVSRGEFREDLYYRLNVLHVTMPTLRERSSDISLLVEHFLKSAAAAGRPKKLSKAAEKRLLEYSWPGNVRQLRNVIESATVLGKGTEIQPDDLVLPDKSKSSGRDTWKPISLQELDRDHVVKVLEHTKGNKKRAAEILGIERCTLYSKLKSYDL